jgi:CheY-like chemotaxis protein
MNTKRILIVDDEPSITRLLKLAIEHHRDYEVRTANSGTDALLAVCAFQPHLILLDLMMPELSGAEVATQLGLDPLLSRIPVIFLTAAVRTEELGGICGRIGGRTLVAKPIKVSAVLSILDQALANRANLTSCPSVRNPTRHHPTTVG